MNSFKKFYAFTNKVSKPRNSTTNETYKGKLSNFLTKTETVAHDSST